MEHLDSGTLHAYLDDQLDAGAHPGRPAIEAHLAECPECRASLEDARRVRDQARHILAEADPRRVVAPPFAEVLARVARQRSRRSSRPMVVLAWAASLALAATVGWYARNLALGRLPDDATANAVATRDQPRAPGIEATPPAARVLAQAVPARSDTATPAVTEPVATGAGALPSTGGVAAQTRPVADVALAEAKGAEVEPAPAPAALPAPALRRAESRELSLPVEDAWVTVSPAEAARRLGGPLAMIPGLPSLGTSVSGAGESVVARTIQVLGPGLTIELTQSRAPAQVQGRAAAPAAPPRAQAAVAEEGPGSVTVPWEGFSVSGRALVPPDSLRKLLHRLAAGGSLR